VNSPGHVGVASLSDSGWCNLLAFGWVFCRGLFSSRGRQDGSGGFGDRATRPLATHWALPFTAHGRGVRRAGWTSAERGCRRVDHSPARNRGGELVLDSGAAWTALGACSPRPSSSARCRCEGLRPACQPGAGAALRANRRVVLSRRVAARPPIGEVLRARPVADGGLGGGEKDSGRPNVDVRREDQLLSRARDITMRRTWLAPS
jgi:hypothetical protein